MTSLRVYLQERTAEEFRKFAMERFGYSKGSISTAAEAAIQQWVSRERYVDQHISYIVETAKKDANVLSVFLFGSYVRKDINYRDIDVSILLKNDDVNSPEFLVKYEDEKGLFDVSMMNRLPLNIQMRVFKDGKSIYSKDKEAVYDYYFRCLDEWEDFRPVFKSILARRKI